MHSLWAGRMLRFMTAAGTSGARTRIIRVKRDCPDKSDTFCYDYIFSNNTKGSIL